jgi:hypothetical protein
MLVYCGSQKRNDSSCASNMDSNTISAIEKGGGGGAIKWMIALQHPGNVTSILFFLECRFLSGHLRDLAFFSERVSDCLTSKGTKRSANHVPAPHLYENQTAVVHTARRRDRSVRSPEICLLCSPKGQHHIHTRIGQGHRVHAVDQSACRRGRSVISQRRGI